MISPPGDGSQQIRTCNLLGKSPRESTTRYRLLFENNFDAVLWSESDGLISAANPKACVMFDMTEEELCHAGRAGIINPANRWLTEAGDTSCVREGPTRVHLRA